MSSSAPVDTATIAFRRVLAESTAGEQARVDALVVLAQRKLYAATWPGPNQVARTLTNSDGETALPLFTGLDALDATATRFGWRDPDGSLQFRELGAREALRHALARGVHFVVLDIGTDHSVEFSRDELEPLLQLQTGRHSSGPFAGTGDAKAAILDAVRRTSKPPTAAYLADSNGTATAAIGGEARPGRQTPKRPISQPLGKGVKPPSVKPPPVLSANDNREPVRQRTPIPGIPGAGTAPRAIAAAGGIRSREDLAAARAVAPPTRDDLKTHVKTLEAPKLTLQDALRLGISAALRAFPEVEWACVVSDESVIPVIGVRVDPSFLNRVAEITDAILGAAEKQGVELQVLLLNNAELVKSAHKHGQAFYPWRK